MVPGLSEGSPRQTRLDTWKSIAHHLGRSSRTVQRWHSMYGMPVHHLSGESGSVYAYSDDLDAWLKARGRIGDLEVSLIPDLEPSRTGFSPDSLHHHNNNWDSSLISSQARVRSDQLVALAAKRWETLSHCNLPGILHHYREAIDLNPGCAPAYVGLSMGLIAQGAWGLVSPLVAYASARAALGEAVKIDSELPLAKCASAWLKMLSARDWDGARHRFEETLEHDPSCVRSVNGRGLLYIAEGRLNEASELFLEGAQRSPLSSASMTMYCWSRYLAGQFEYALHLVDEIRATGQSGPLLDAVEALAAIQVDDREVKVYRIEALAAEGPHHDVLRGALGYAYAVNGQVKRARELLESMTNRAKGKMNREPYAIALILIGMNEQNQAADYLEQSYRGGSLWSLGFRSDPILEPLRSRPRLSQFLRELGYPESEDNRSRLGSVA
jgi:tetratricopeptide (TPR) repeat protein